CMAAAHRKRRAPRRRKQRIAQTPQQPVAEIIGRASYPQAQRALFRSRAAITSVDVTIPDYIFYDHLRRGKQPGYKLGALFARRIERVFSTWVLGRGVTLALAESGDPDNANDPRTYTDALLSRWIEAQHATLMSIKEDVLGLGDMYIFVNPDGPSSVPSPDTVEETRHPLDYRTATQVMITTRLPEYTVEDVYTPTERVITWRKGDEIERVERFANLIGR